MGASNRMVATILEVADLDRSLALYRDGFGIDLHLADHGGDEGDHADDDRWISGRHAATSWTDGAFFHFALYESKGERTTGVQLGLEVADLPTAHGAALTAGAEVVHAPRREPWGHSARYRDPDGNVVELTQRSPSADERIDEQSNSGTPARVEPGPAGEPGNRFGV